MLGDGLGPSRSYTSRQNREARARAAPHSLPLDPGFRPLFSPTLCVACWRTLLLSLASQTPLPHTSPSESLFPTPIHLVSTPLPFLMHSDFQSTSLDQPLRAGMMTPRPGP